MFKIYEIKILYFIIPTFVDIYFSNVIPWLRSPARRLSSIYFRNIISLHF